MKTPKDAPRTPKEIVSDLVAAGQKMAKLMDEATAMDINFNFNMKPATHSGNQIFTWSANQAIKL